MYYSYYLFIYDVMIIIKIEKRSVDFDQNKTRGKFIMARATSTTYLRLTIYLAASSCCKSLLAILGVVV